MAKVAFILLCHKDPDGIIAQARGLTAMGDYIAIHFDARADAKDFDRIRTALADNPNVTFARRRIKCGWGEWSLVQASLNALGAAVAAFPRATHFYMLSGDCMPIKSASYAHEFLDAQDVDYIESFDFFDSDWIKVGLREDRLIYRHPFNERGNKRLFYGFYNLQKRLGWTRPIPADLKVMIGSQWWCLRRRTIEAVLAFTKSRRDVVRFFRTTWIPDETFFQTVVRHLIPDTQIRSRTLTFLLFSDYGMPVTFYNDHFDLLLAQDYLFARKISANARILRDRLGGVYASGQRDFHISDEGRTLYQFLTGRGRVGRRFAPRVWEAEATLGRGRELLIMVCKKWHVAKRLAASIRATTDIPAIDYLFSEDATPLPDLGGIQTSVDKRTRHHRALMRMLFDYHHARRIVICLDPSHFALMRDFCTDRATTRILEIECDFTDDYLIGHAQRVGLAGQTTSRAALDRLLPTLRNDLRFESDRIRDAEFSGFYRLRQSANPAENAIPLAAFLGIAQDQARVIAETDHLFTD